MTWEILKDPNNPANDLSTERLAIHAALVETPEGPSIVYFDGVFGTVGTRSYHIQDQTIDATLPTAPSGEHVFCSGHALLADGRWLIGGGVINQNLPHGDAPEALGHDSGDRRCFIYHPLVAKWETIQDLSFQPDSEDNPRGGGRWYPTLLTVETGEVVAIAGHPFAGVYLGKDDEGNNQFDLTGADDYVFPGDDSHRHNNNTAERYSPGSGVWTLLTAESTSHNNHAPDEYPRVHLSPTGHVFFSTLAKGNRRFYDPYSGTYLAEDVNQGDSAYWAGSAATSVLLPILMSDTDNVWVLACGGEEPQRINIAKPEDAQWVSAGGRDTWIDPGAEGAATSPVRNHVCAVILPTGDIFVTGGVGSANADFPQGTSTLVPEIYTPPIDWNTGKYDANADGSWNALTGEPASVVRGYHSVALLLPDGSVWTSGSTDAAGGDDQIDMDENGDPVWAGKNDFRIEIFKPSYFNQQNQRPTVSNVPANIGYGYPFTFNTQANSIERVALIRCGSVTHAFDSDQRMVVVDFDVVNANTIEVTVPYEPRLLPPGRYMLWVIDDQDLPAQWAPLIRISHQKASTAVDVEKFSKTELDAAGVPLTFPSAVHLVYEGFLPGEVEQPDLSLVWKDDQSNVLDEGISIELGAPSYEGGFDEKDIGQRIIYPVHVTFETAEAFDAVPENGFREITLKAQMKEFGSKADLVLTFKRNPRMSDGDTPWLSLDLRAFSVRSDEFPYTADIVHPGSSAQACPYIQDVLTAYNSWTTNHPNTQHPFENLPEYQIEDQLPLYSHGPNGETIFNFAVARVRYRALDVAEDVRVFFRLWTTGWTALDFSTSTTTGSYPRDGDGADATPRLGQYGGEINTIPCFAEPRTAILTNQHDPTNLKPLGPTGADEEYTYFGCWLDTNQDNAFYPIEPDPNSAGPYADPLPIRDLMRGLHQCLVAEIHWPEDPIDSGDTPSSSDNLAQRNLLYDEAPNPGGFASHLVHHTFELKPSMIPLPPHTLQGLSALTPGVTAHGRVAPDELVIDWGNLPRDSHVVFYMPQVDVDAVLRYASRRQGPPNLSKAGAHTIRCKVTDVGFIPIPGGLGNTIAGLVSVQLPPNIKNGQRFSFVLRQVSGGTRQAFTAARRVLGTTQFDIAVKTEAKILPKLTRNLSVLKHIATRIPQDNRWYPVFNRYVGELGDRIRAMGVDPDEIAPTTDGSGKPSGWPYPFPDTGGRMGRICKLVYDKCGRLEGIVLEECRGSKRFCTCWWRRLWCCILRLFCRPCGKPMYFKVCDGAIAEVARRACKERRMVTVYPALKDRNAVGGLIVGCC